MAAPAELQINALDFTLGEIRKVEQVVGTAWKNIDWAAMDADLLIALVYVSSLRDDPTFTLEQAAETKMSVVMDALNQPTAAAVDDEDPTPSPSESGGE